MLEFETYTLEDKDIYGGVSYDFTLCSSADFTIGNTPSAKITFTTASPASGECLFTRDESRQIGYFTVQNVQRNGDKYLCEAYDRMLRFEKVVDPWLSTLVYPMTMKAYLHSLCDFCNVPFKDTDFLNHDMYIEQKIEGQNISGRQILAYIAEAAGTNAVINSEGELELQYYTDIDKVLDWEDYATLTTALYTTPRITKLWIGKEDGDLGIEVSD